MPPKLGRPRKQKRKNNLDGPGNISHSESTTNRKNTVKLESSGWDCPLSARRVLIPNSTPISGLRRSSRLSTRCIENGTTSLEQVGGIHVENSIVRIPEKAGELGEPEMSLSNNSNQIVGQNDLEAEGIPLEQEPLVGEIQALNKFEEITVNDNRKSISRAGCSSQSVSLKLTEMVGMIGEEDDDEVDSNIQSWLEDTVNGYHVKPEFMPILRKIIGKHGDIAKNCAAESVVYRSALLEMICGIISELDKMDVANITGKDLKKKISLVDEIKMMEVEVEWLHTRLTEIFEARQILKQSGKLKEKLDSNKESIEIAESALQECETAKKKLKAICDKEALWKERLARSQDECTKTYQEIKSARSRVKQFLNCSLVDDLL
ncbi:uncharacterized protein LOC123917051 isoform X2 [Trifolium pratense]|uniref:uncharacterized protein LOC123917051 isoform X1 n=1 Tax=Trifolium pratense TaxID=57577 RepID=UPI001E6974B8|nr:uncharacterized protein LOC123917051 isoform X1 [Trifolium pratense]XP_045824620.1 uncharacterized protein LOC123917051 isoform X2 [Trifolium pratense]